MKKNKQKKILGSKSALLYNIEISCDSKCVTSQISQVSFCDKMQMGCMSLFWDIYNHTALQWRYFIFF